MQGLFDRPEYVIEIIGVALAALSFSGWAVKLEDGLSVLRRGLRAYAPVLGGGLGEFLPTPATVQRYGWLILRFIIVTLT